MLRLLASGKTNHAIAADRVLADRTVDRHVSSIFAKLGVNTRAAVTVVRIPAPPAAKRHHRELAEDPSHGRTNR